MSYGGISADDWDRWDKIGGGIGVEIDTLDYSVFTPPLTSPVHRDKFARFKNNPTNKSWCIHTYKDPRNAVHRFNGNTHQSIWCTWNGGQYYLQPFHPNLDLGLRYQENQTNAYYLVADSAGIFVTDYSYNGGFGRLWPYPAWEGSPPRDSSAVAYHPVAFANLGWHAVKLSVEPSGTSQIVRAFYATGIDVVDDVDEHGEPEWTPAIEIEHVASGSDVCTLGTKIKDFLSAPLTTGKPCFVINAGYAGVGSYPYGRMIIDSLGIKLEDGA